MNRPLTALFAALEALLVAAIGVGIPLVPLTLLWAVQYGLQIDWLVFWRAAADIWLLGSGVDVTMTLDPAIATSLGFAGAGKPFVLTIALLGFALLTALLGARAGRRIGQTPHWRLGALTGIVTFAVVSLVITLSTVFASARPSLWQGILLPTLVFTIGMALGTALARSRPVDAPAAVPADRGIPYRSVGATVLRGGSGAAAIVVAAAGILLALRLLFGYGKIIALYEGLHAGALGGVAVTVGQLAFLPNLVIWTASWLVGPGFAIGTGSSVSPIATSLGPIPAIPVLGALPSGGLSWGYLGLLVPVLAGFAVAIVLRPRLVRALGPGKTVWLVVAGVAIGVVGGIALGLLAWASAGSAGPGRLVDVGPSPWLVAAYGALEIGVAAAIGMLVGRPPRSGGEAHPSR
ncbi:MAG TPA: DUF6350 family protein [Lacisediminihabitans sp.]|uniref:cell division protein PerM n=1 Tax=Lacisediminihabitans sp. TaxID=2787631 RepID=UPI002ED8EEF1